MVSLDGLCGDDGVMCCHGDYRQMKTLPFAAIVLLATAWPAATQEWPSKPVRIVVPFGAGSTPDIIMRLIGERLQAKIEADRS